MAHGIETSEISVVVQGAIDKVYTPKCLKLVRKYLPGSEIILSTWEKSNTDGMEYDQVLYNKDPGAVRDKFNQGFVNNTTRQLVSTQNGIQLAHGKYILKIRSDLLLRSNVFLKYFHQYNKSDSRFSLFQHRVIFSSLFSKKFCSAGYQNQPLPFHMGDWFVFGEAADIKYLYEISLPKEPEMSWNLAIYPYKGVKVNLLNGSHQYAPEQYIFFNACKKKFPEISFSNYLDYDRENTMWSEKIIANSCIILDPCQIKYISGKIRANNDKYRLWTKNISRAPETLRRGLYTHEVFNEDYKKYCLEMDCD